MNTIEPHPQQGWVQMPVALYRDRRLRPIDRDVYAMLKAGARQDGHTFKSVEAIASELGVSEDTVKRSLKRLREAGHVLLEDQGRRADGTHGQVTKWLLTDVVEGQVVNRVAGMHPGNTDPQVRPGGTDAPRSQEQASTGGQPCGAVTQKPRSHRVAPVPPYIDTHTRHPFKRDAFGEHVEEEGPPEPPAPPGDAMPGSAQSSAPSHDPAPASRPEDGHAFDASEPHGVLAPIRRQRGSTCTFDGCTSRATPGYTKCLEHLPKAPRSEGRE